MSGYVWTIAFSVLYVGAGFMMDFNLVSQRVGFIYLIENKKFIWSLIVEISAHSSNLKHKKDKAH